MIKLMIFTIGLPKNPHNPKYQMQPIQLQNNQINLQLHTNHCASNLFTNQNKVYLLTYTMVSSFTCHIGLDGDNNSAYLACGFRFKATTVRVEGGSIPPPPRVGKFVVASPNNTHTLVAHDIYNCSIRKPL